MFPTANLTMKNKKKNHKN